MGFFVDCNGVRGDAIAAACLLIGVSNGCRHQNFLHGAAVTGAEQGAGNADFACAAV